MGDVEGQLCPVGVLRAGAELDDLSGQSRWMGAAVTAQLEAVPSHTEAQGALQDVQEFDPELR